MAFLVASCAASDADFQTQVLGGGDEYTVLVYDASGLVTGVAQVEWRPNGLDDVRVLPDEQRVDIAWTGGACEHQPRLQVTGSATDLTIDVSNPRDPNWLPFLPIGCPSVGVPLSVTLSLNVSVDRDAVDLEVHYQ